MAAAIALVLAGLLTLALAAAGGSARPSAAHAAEQEAPAVVEVSSEGTAARMADVPFALADFARIEKGSNRPVDGVYHGYRYLMDAPADSACLVDATAFVVVYVPAGMAADAGFDLGSPDDRQALMQLFAGLDAAASSGNRAVSTQVPWAFTSDRSFVERGVAFGFSQELEPGSLYVTVQGADGSALTSAGTLEETTGAEGRAAENQAAADAEERAAESQAAAPGSQPVAGFRLSHVAFATVQPEQAVSLAPAPTAWDSLGAFFAGIDYSPLFVTLKTGFTALFFIVVLGLLAAWWSLRLPSRAQDVADAVLTIPLVLPPTVCGFLLLLLLGHNTPVGAWFDEVGFPLVFSWPATVIAAVVVAFPLMYRSARGAFESLDRDMLDAARTLGWGEGRIFVQLMLPLAWSQIAAGTMLAFARALGEFGATLFLAGNYAGITRTIPIAIYFEWMGGHTDVALFWTVVVMAISFGAVFLINRLGRHANRYRAVRSSQDVARPRKEAAR